MTVRAIRAVSRGYNGIGAFVLQCKKVDVHYCNWGGSSRGMKGFIKSLLPAFAAANPEVEISVSPRPNKHPVLIGHYINGRQKAICVRNMEPYEIQQKAEILRNSSGEKNKKANKPVTSITASARGVWSPYHGKGIEV